MTDKNDNNTTDESGVASSAWLSPERLKWIREMESMRKSLSKTVSTMVNYQISEERWEGQKDQLMIEGWDVLEEIVSRSRAKLSSLND
jgi:hypothetical protein